MLSDGSSDPDSVAFVERVFHFTACSSGRVEMEGGAALSIVSSAGVWLQQPEGTAGVTYLQHRNRKPF